MLKSFEHIGMRVRDLDVSVPFYTDLLGLKLVERTDGETGSGAFLDAGGGMLEMSARIKPLKRATDLPDDQCGLMHLAFCYDSVDETFAELEKAGVKIDRAPSDTINRTLFQRKAFVRDPDGILIELLQRNPAFEG